MSTYKERMLKWFENRKNLESLKFDEGEEISIYDGEGLASGKIKHMDPDSDFPDWFRDYGNHFREKAYMNGEYKGKLVGMSYTYIDYYYIVQDDDFNIHYITCVANLETKK